MKSKKVSDMVGGSGYGYLGHFQKKQHLERGHNFSSSGLLQQISSGLLNVGVMLPFLKTKPPVTPPGAAKPVSGAGARMPDMKGPFGVSRFMQGRGFK